MGKYFSFTWQSQGLGKIRKNPLLLAIFILPKMAACPLRHSFRFVSLCFVFSFYLILFSALQAKIDPLFL